LSLPPYIDWKSVHECLKLIFPEGTVNRNYCVREAAAKTVFTMLYVGAIDGTGNWLGPKQVYRMTDAQAALSTESDRNYYAGASMKPGFAPIGRTWYSDNSREQIRDETIRQGLVTNNAVIERLGLATTSSKPRYALLTPMAALFDPTLSGRAIESAAASWRHNHLSAAARARTALVRQGMSKTGDGILVTFPNGETRRMAPGPSSVISKKVIEDFARRYLTEPAVLWLSESRAKVIKRDDDLAAQINLQISADRNLPDIILVDLGGTSEADFVLVFVEVVASDGPITAQRQNALLKIATDAGFPAKRVAFVTAYLDRSHAAFKKTVSDLAWRSFAWFAAEPEHLLVFHDGTESKALSLILSLMD
jgi:hypothetical protein